MKKKVIVLLLMVISLFGFVNIGEVKAYTVEDMDNYMKEYFTGSGTMGNGWQVPGNSYFNGYVINLCKYVTHNANNDVETSYIRYSLKDGQRKLFFVGAALYNNNSSDVSPLGIYVSPGSATQLKNSDYLIVHDPVAITKNLVEKSQCPYLFINSDMYNHTRKYYYCLSSTNNGCKDEKHNDLSDSKKRKYEGTAYSSNNNIQDNITTAHDLTITALDVNNEKLGKVIFQKLYYDMINKGDCKLDESFLSEQISLAEKYYKNLVKKGVITNYNSSGDVTSQVLPKIITNCNGVGKNVDKGECIDQNITNNFQKYYEDIDTGAANIAPEAVTTCQNNLYSSSVNDLYSAYEKCLQDNASNESVCNELKQNYEAAKQEAERKIAEENKDNTTVINNVVKQFQLVPEAQKTKGCEIFGKATTDIIKWIYNLVKFGAPILVVVLGIIDFVQALLSGDDKGFKEAWQRFVKRIIAAVVVILLPVILTFLLDISGVLDQYGIEGSGTDIYCIFK